MSDKKKSAAVAQVGAYQEAFDYLNRELFDGKLGACMLVLSRNSESIGGYFSPDRWANEDGDKVIPEIGINANRMTGLDIQELFGKLVHEMAHLWQFEKGSASRTGYHNQEWILKAAALGLTVEGSGQAVSTSLMDGGAAALAIAGLPDSAVWPWLANSPLDANQGGGDGSGAPGGLPAGPVPVKKSGKRARYTCPVCGLNAWAKFGAVIVCGDCSQVMVGGSDDSGGEV